MNLTITAQYLDVTAVVLERIMQIWFCPAGI